ncbi:MAG: alpha/beta hydrolase [Bacteroidota bacterium]
MKIQIQALWLIFVLLLSSCSVNSYLSEREKEFGTSGKNKWLFHRLSDRDKGTSLAFPGYVIGIEKAKRKNIGAPSRKDIRKNNGLQSFGFNERNNWDSISNIKRWVLNDVKSMFLSSIFEFSSDQKPVDRITVSSIYDAYDPSFLADSKNAYQNGFDELEKFRILLMESITQKKVTHVFLFCMGWNSDQQEAIRNFNSLFLKIMDNANLSKEEFNPIFIGITWPSLWNEGFTNAFSFFNKTNDADEIGITWANLILNKAILSEKNKAKFKTVVLGHSFGAKLTSRATMSSSMLKEPSKPVDLLINLQSAYSINRYSKIKGIEPTADYVNWNKYVHHIALICSENDGAVKNGFYAPFAGGIRSYNRVLSHPEQYPNIDLVAYKKGVATTFKYAEQLLLIDASEIIRQEAYKKGGGAHSDIYNKEVSKMLWELIHSSTYGQLPDNAK